MRMIGEVSELLGIETVRIFEKILLNKRIMAPFIQKDRGITYINNEGIEQLRELFQLSTPSDPASCPTKTEDGDHAFQERIWSIKEVLQSKRERLDELDREILRMDDLIDATLKEHIR